MGNTVFRYFLEWLKNELHEEAYKRLVKSIKKRESAYRAKESTAFVGPGWISSQSNTATSNENVKSDESIVQFNVKDQMYTIANSFVSGIDGLLQTYFPGEENKKKSQFEYIDNNFREWQKANKGKKHPQLWELAQTEGDEDWLDWIHDHVWTYIGLSAPLLGAINPVRAVIRCVII